MKSFSTQEQAIATAQYLSAETNQDWRAHSEEDKDHYCIGSDFVLYREVPNNVNRGLIFKNIWPTRPDFEGYWGYSRGSGDLLQGLAPSLHELLLQPGVLESMKGNSTEELQTIFDYSDYGHSCEARKKAEAKKVEEWEYSEPTLIWLLPLFGFGTSLNLYLTRR